MESGLRVMWKMMCKVWTLKSEVGYYHFFNFSFQFSSFFALIGNIYSHPVTSELNIGGTRLDT